ncbi:laccase-12 [Physcomitrium patens]|uniref:laccase-12 n=1 Tax=Physcomitrium patens TaxID=3218 RepID=UPI003CCCE687
MDSSQRCDHGQESISAILRSFVIAPILLLSMPTSWLRTRVTRNCATVDIPTVNGRFPGPTIEVNEGDKLIVKVTNKQQYPVTLHWHGIKQFKTNYADGPAHITQCPIQPNKSYIYEFTVNDQRGTFFWHAHVNWMRATVHGALIIHPKKTAPYGEVEGEIPIIMGEFFGLHPNVVELGFINTLTPVENKTSLASTINGFPGSFFNCSSATKVYKVKKDKTYLLRIIDAAINSDHYFAVANHSVTVVAADGNYLKPFETAYVPMSPGQTTEVLIKFDKPRGRYYFGMNAGPVPTVGAPPPFVPAVAIMRNSSMREPGGENTQNVQSSRQVWRQLNDDNHLHLASSLGSSSILAARIERNEDLQEHGAATCERNESDLVRRI